MSGVQGVIGDPATLITAVVGAVVALGGLRMSRSGQRAERAQQMVANELQRKAQDHDYYRGLVADQRAEIDRLHGELVEERRRYTQDMGHQRDVTSTLRDVVRSEVAKHLADDAMDAADRALDPEDDG